MRLLFVFIKWRRTSFHFGLTRPLCARKMSSSCLWALNKHKSVIAHVKSEYWRRKKKIRSPSYCDDVVTTRTKVAKYAHLLALGLNFWIRQILFKKYSRVKVFASYSNIAFVAQPWLKLTSWYSKTDEHVGETRAVSDTGLFGTIRE